MNFLIINAHQKHPGIAEGKLNSFLFETIKQEIQTMGNEIQTTEVEKGYNIKEEIEKHLWADGIIIQTPVYWFGTPWMHKKYTDEVFNQGVGKIFKNDGRSKEDPSKQYGMGGLLKAKVMFSSTWNAPKEAFNDKNQYLFEGKSVDEALIQITTTYKFCGAKIFPSFSCFNVMKDPTIEEDVKKLKIHLEQFNEFVSK